MFLSRLTTLFEDGESTVFFSTSCKHTVSLSRILFLLSRADHTVHDSCKSRESRKPRTMRKMICLIQKACTAKNFGEGLTRMLFGDLKFAFCSLWSVRSARGLSVEELGAMIARKIYFFLTVRAICSHEPPCSQTRRNLTNPDLFSAQNLTYESSAIMHVYLLLKHIMWFRCSGGSLSTARYNTARYFVGNWFTTYTSKRCVESPLCPHPWFTTPGMWLNSTRAMAALSWGLPWLIISSCSGKR